MLLGAFGTQQDVSLLREASSSPFAPGTPEAQRRIVEFGFAVAAAELGDPDALESVRAEVFAPEEQGELALLACEALGTLGDQTYAGVLRREHLRPRRAKSLLRSAWPQQVPSLNCVPKWHRLSGLLSPGPTNSH